MDDGALLHAARRPPVRHHIHFCPTVQKFIGAHGWSSAPSGEASSQIHWVQSLVHSLLFIVHFSIVNNKNVRLVNHIQYFIGFM